MGSASYKQLQLQPPEIRLLILRPAKPARKRKNDIIDCTLLHVLLEDDNLHKFKALSYSWGDPETTYPIRLNGAVYRVTQSLGSFLSRQRVESHQQQYLWVDALCINQDDIEEKKHQIGLMRTIYSRAAELLVWLGDEIDGGSSGIEMLANFEDFVGTGIRPAVPQESQMAKINDVLTRQWFDRTWIVQEIVLGAHDEKSDRTWVISGGKRVSWIIFKECVGYLSKFNQLLRHQFPYIHKLMVLEDLRVKYSPSNTELARPLLWWVTKCRGQATSDSRDKIYGVLGIASDPQALSRFPADYNISASALFLQFTAFNLDMTRDLAILRQCQYQALEDLPSWVPDWSVPTKEHPLWNFLDEEDTTEEEFDLIEIENPDGILLIKQVPLHKSHYRAAAGSAAKYNLRKTTLEIEGIMVGQITYIEPAFISDVKTRWQDSTRFMMQVSRCKAVQEALPEQPNPYGTKNGRTKAFWRALMADHGGDGQYRPLLFTYKNWLNLIPLDWEPAPCHITARPRGTYELIQDRAQYLMLGLSAFLKERNLTLGGQDWKDFEPTSLKDFPITEISKGFNEGVASGFGSEEFFEGLLEDVPEYGPQEIRQLFEALHDLTSMRTSLPESKDAEEERARMLADMNALATEWEAAGPYDLVNSPFYLPSAIPDRYSRHRPDPVFEFKVADAHPRERAVMADVAEKKVRVTRLDADAKEVTGKVGREKYALGRRFFVMGGEGYMGLAPPLAEKGDIIAVLLGGDVPFILRPVEGTASFRLVGEAHVQGIMDGEVMERLADGQCSSRSFQLV